MRPPSRQVWKRSDILYLRKCYNEAQKYHRDVFLFMGHQVAVSYAKYLLEYLDPEGKIQDNTLYL